MPLLPDPDALTRVSVQPNTAVARYAAGAEGEALANLGQAIGQAGGHTANMYMLYKDQIDHTAANMALVSLSKAQTALQIGPDGFHQTKLGATTAPDFRETTLGRFDSAAEKSAVGLTPNAKRYYDAGAASQRTGFNVDLTRHQMAETEKNVGEVYKATQSNLLDNSVSFKSIPEKVSANMKEMRANAEIEMTRQGVTDKVVRDNLLQTMDGAVHGAIISSHIDDGATVSAANHFTEHKGAMNIAQRDATERQLGPVRDFALAQSVASAAAAMRVSGKTEPEINAHMILLSQGSRRVFEDARHLDGVQQGAIRAQYDQVESKATQSMLDGKYSEVAKTLSTLARAGTPEAVVTYNNIKDRTERYQLTQSHEAQRRLQDDPAAILKAQDLYEASRNGNLTQEKLKLDIANISRADFGRIAASIEASKTAAGRANIDADTIKAASLVASDSTTEKALFKTEVERLHADWKAANPGKLAQEAEINKILSSARQNYVDTSKRWYQASTVEAFKAKRDVSYPSEFETAFPKMSEPDRVQLFQDVRAQRQAKPVELQKYSDQQIAERLHQLANPRK